MTGFTPKEKLTAYARWQVTDFDQDEPPAARHATQPAAPLSTPPAAMLAETALTLPTATDIERLHQEAHAQGYQAGYGEGMAHAGEIAALFTGLLDNLQNSLRELDQQVADQLLATSLEIAQQVLRQSLDIKPELLLPVVREAIASLHGASGNLLLFVHPDDAALIRSRLGDQLALHHWRIVEESSLTRGGCRIEQNANEVDATLETRWRRTIESIGITPEWLNDKP